MSLRPVRCKWRFYIIIAGSSPRLGNSVQTAYIKSIRIGASNSAKSHGEDRRIEAHVLLHPQGTLAYLLQLLRTLLRWGSRNGLFILTARILRDI